MENIICAELSQKNSEVGMNDMIIRNKIYEDNLERFSTHKTVDPLVEEANRIIQFFLHSTLENIPNEQLNVLEFTVKKDLGDWG